MRIKIDKEFIDLPIQTVILAHNEADPDESILFRCYHCGTVITRTKGTVVKIVAGTVPGDQVMSLQQCYKCHETYTFQTVWQKMTSDYIHLTLSPQPEREVSTFHCITCRNPNIQYNNEFAVLLPEMKPLRSPTMFSCLTVDCPRKYLFNEVVSF